MTKMDLRKRIHRAVDSHLSTVKGDPYLLEKILCNSEKGEIQMKRKLALAPAILLIVALCFTALAAGGFGLKDFLTRYRAVDMPNDWNTYVQAPVLRMATQHTELRVKDMLYDSRCLRLTADCVPFDSKTMLIGLDAEPYDRIGLEGGSFVNEAYAQGGFTEMRRVELFTNSDADDIEMDYILHPDGSMTVYLACTFTDIADERDVELMLIDSKVTNPEANQTDDGYHADIQSIERVNETLRAVSNSSIQVLVCDTPAEYPSCGICVESLRLECSMLEIYYTLSCRVTDEEAYNARGQDCFFEFVDSTGDETEILEDGVSSSASVSFPEEDGRFTAHGSLRFTEVRDSYEVRLFNPFESGKTRYETNRFEVKPEA